MKKFILFTFITAFAFNTSAQCDSNLPISENFDDSNVVDVCWNLIDQDGDTKNWRWREWNSANGGYRCIESTSFNTSDGAQTPDNWIISYPIDLTSFNSNDNITLSWKVRGEYVGFAHEYYTIYADTNNGIPDFESSPIKRGEYVDEVGGEGVFATRSLDISSLVGETVYIAFRHHNSTNQFNINIDDVTVERSSTLGIDDLQQHSFKHYYNAYTDILTLDSSDAPMNAIVVYNILGQAVLNEKLHQTEETISLSSLNDGIYIIQVNLNGIDKTFKFIKS